MLKAQLQKAQLLGTCNGGRQVTDTYVSVVGCKTGTNEEPFAPPVRTAVSNARAEAILQSLKPMVSRTKKALIAAPASAPASAQASAQASNIRIQDLVTPQTYKQALRSDQCLQWKRAMKEEHESLMLNGTWEYLQRKDIPPNERAISCKWVYRIKENDDSSLRYKARLVFRGFEQTECGETFAPVPNC